MEQTFLHKWLNGNDQSLRKWSFRNVYTVKKYFIQVPHLCYIHKVYIVHCSKLSQAAINLLK